MKKTILRATFFIVEAILITIVIIAFYLSQPINSQKIIYIPKGTIKEIISYLIDKNINLSKLDIYILRAIGNPQSGFIDLEKDKLTRGDFLYKLTKAKSALTTITLIPSETNYFFILDIAKKLNLSASKLLNAYNKYTNYSDGVILANTYKIPIGFDEDKLMKYLISNSMKIHKKLSIEYLGKWDEKKWFKYVTIASIIEKEAGNDEERGLVSAVIYNRLKRGMKLQMDGTLNYGKYSHSKVTPQRIKEDESHFNTYKFRGVPPSPISSVTINSIESALFPEDVKYLYFFKKDKNSHVFSNSYKEHLRNIERYRK